jgi:hypothetical protein
MSEHVPVLNTPTQSQPPPHRSFRVSYDQSDHRVQVSKHEQSIVQIYLVSESPAWQCLALRLAGAGRGQLR